MGVTEKRLRKSLFLPALAIMALVGCTVTQSGSTPGAFTCNPGPTDLTNFYNNVYTSGSGYNASPGGSGKTCLICHGVAPGDDHAYGSEFHIIDINATDPGVEKVNFCTAYMLGQLSPQQPLINHPMDAYHVGGRYSSTDISNLINWVQTATITGQ